VLSVAGRHILRCLNHAQVRISTGSRHHSEDRDLGRIDTVGAYSLSSLEVAEPP
jgi:hypothetical protein